MRKKISVLASIGITVLMLVACGSTNNSSSPSPEVPNGNPNSSSTTEQIQNDKIENDNSTIPPNQEEDKKLIVTT